MNQQLHCLALELLVVSFLNLLFLHGFSLFTLSFRVRKIRGGSSHTVRMYRGCVEPITISDRGRVGGAMGSFSTLSDMIPVSIVKRWVAGITSVRRHREQAHGNGNQ